DPVVIPHCADGAGWMTQTILVNNSSDEMQGEIHFVGQGSLTDPPHGIEVGTAVGTASVFEYDIPAGSFYRLQTNGLLDTLSTGAIQVIPFTGYNAPAAHAIVAEFIPTPPASDTEPITGNTIYETSVEGQLPAATLRLYGEASGDFYGSKPKSTVTAVAIANPAGTPAMVQLEVTSFNDVRLGVSSPIDIAPNGQ